jgi:hypothetical protein
VLAKRCESLLLNPEGGFYNIERLENIAVVTAAINVRLNIDLPHHALSVSYYNNNDFYNKLADNEKSDFIWYLASDFALECPPGNDHSLKIGIEWFFAHT